MLRQIYKVGEILHIYQDPINQEDFEGKAKLIKLVKRDDYGETWMVKFTGETHSYMRRIEY